MSEISKVIESEIADFFAGFGGPGEPDIQNGEAQRLLTERVLSVLALRERAEPIYQERLFHVSGKKQIEYWAEINKGAYQYLPESERRIVYTSPPSPVLPEWTNQQCLEFLAIAFRHAEIKGDFELDDLRLGVKMANAMTPGKEG
ncbi:hypothetical protein SMC50_003181 [Cronobacter sakazakii]|nr:hypothetical protein [Cronobacter sakazakii]ELY2637455.1 hypothetical protein [Cronobacter sakazakii]ELY2658535.1 hypothetical protein [Cronobacter sakazakii]ELY4639692.1 hypothetical protein [Cronobacter sakazakii]ELY4833875.1 hypothetical protein [Cronobacter sakazakii]